MIITACVHTDRKYHAKGKCASCYRREYIKTWVNPRKAECHPDRPHYAKGLCFTCSTKSRDRRKEKLALQYNLTKEQYAEMLEEQGGVCQICSKPQQRDMSLSVDHDHATGAVRGLLCSDCNFGLGWFSDNTEKLKKAAEYLEKYRA